MHTAFSVPCEHQRLEQLSWRQVAVHDRIMQVIEAPDKSSVTVNEVLRNVAPNRYHAR